MTIKEFKEALDIFSKYFEKGEEKSYFMKAEYDELFIFVSLESLPLDSEDGKRLQEIGFGEDDSGEGWSIYT